MRRGNTIRQYESDIDRYIKNSLYPNSFEVLTPYTLYDAHVGPISNKGIQFFVKAKTFDLSNMYLSCMLPNPCAFDIKRVSFRNYPDDLKMRRAYGQITIGSKSYQSFPLDLLRHPLSYFKVNATILPLQNFKVEIQFPQTNKNEEFLTHWGYVDPLYCILEGRFYRSIA